MTPEELLIEAQEAVASLRARLDNQPQLTTGIPKKAEVIVTESRFDPSRLIRPVGDDTDAAAGGGGGDEPPPPPPPHHEPPGPDSCYCEDFGDDGIMVRVPDGDGEREKDWCERTLKCHGAGNGEETTIDIENKFRGAITDCTDGEEVDWFFTPDENQLNDMLSLMGFPPWDFNPDGVYNVTVYLTFRCTRMENRVDGHWVPIAPESGSGIYLTGICYIGIAE